MADHKENKNYVLPGLLNIDRSGQLQAMVLDEKSPSSSIARKLFCDCGSGDREPSNIEQVPEISNLAGLLIQNNYGDSKHPADGTSLTLKWADFDRETREAEMKVYGGCGGKQHTGQWSIHDTFCNRYWVVPGARLINYTYRFRFSEDWKRADIEIRCCCTPSGETCCGVPACLLAFDMVQTEDSVNGSRWVRRNELCKKGKFPFYDLEAVYTSDGSPTKLVTNFEKKTPERMLLTR